MSQKFQATVQNRGDVSYVKLGGVIDEDNALADLADRIPSGTAVIDLGEIERINSCGVRDWVNWLSKLEQHGTRSVLVECSPAIVAQINLVNNFAGDGAVKSFYVPYFCPECDEEKVLLVEATDMGDPPHEPPTCRCDECDLVMDFDDMPDSYFAFLAARDRRDHREPASALARVSDLGTSSKGKVRSRVSQAVLVSDSDRGVPSRMQLLPSGVHTGGTGPRGGTNVGRSRPNSRPPLGTSPPSSPEGRPPKGTGPGSSQPIPGSSFGFAAQNTTRQVPEPARSNGVMFVLIAILIGALGVLAYLVLTKS